MPVLQPEGVEFATSVFKELDKDGSGTLDQSELKAAAKGFAENLGQDPPSDEAIEARQNALGVEQVTLEDFIIFCGMIKLTMICDVMFTKASGGADEINESQLKVVMTNVREDAGLEPPSDDDVAAAMKDLDQSGDGKIDFLEFCAFMVPILVAAMNA